MPSAPVLSFSPLNDNQLAMTTWCKDGILIVLIGAQWKSADADGMIARCNSFEIEICYRLGFQRVKRPDF